MLKQCIRCKEVKFDSYFYSQFYSEFTGLYIAVSDVCKRCANQLKGQAVWDYQDQLTNNL